MSTPIDTQLLQTQLHAQKEESPDTFDLRLKEIQEAMEAYNTELRVVLSQLDDIGE